jgi:hypothetical protein
MADPWNNATSYSPGATVSYNGLVYYRSQYPPTPTSGTPPNVETGTDDKGDQAKTKLNIKPPLKIVPKAAFVGKESLTSQIRSAMTFGRG